MCFEPGDNRPSSSGLREMGCGLCFESDGGATSRHDGVSRETNESQADCLLANLPSTMGNHGTGLHQRDGFDFGSSVRSCRRPQKDREVGGGDRAPQSKEKASVSKEAKARRNLVDIGVSTKSCTSSKGSLCSGPSACKDLKDDNTFRCGANLPPQDALPFDKPAFWNSLQTFSFRQWCSRLLSEALATKTPFAAFLKTTLQASRSCINAPEQALFPLPFPKLGIFRSCPSRVSSRVRAKLHFDQAFHVMIAALNYLHADCSFPPLDLMIRIPSRAQQSALWNLRCLFKAFGNSGEEFQVPRSGRRSTNLIASLCDLSEFLTRSGAGVEPYKCGFSGDGSSLMHGNQICPDLSLAEELVPYRQLDFSRIRLSGRGDWDPRCHLSDALVLPFLEPEVLCGQTSFDFDNLPNLEREDPDQVLGLAKLWDVNGLLHLRADLVEEERRPACIRCFNCFKDADQDRLIGDRRGRNQLELSVLGPSRHLPTGPSLCVLELPKHCTLSVCASDRKDFYHQFKVAPTRSRTNVMWPPLPVSFLQSTRAYEDLLARFSQSKKLGREDKGDNLRNLEGPLGSALSFSKKAKPPKGNDLVHCCFGTIAQGDHLGVELATDSHRNLLASRGLLCNHEDLVTSRPFAGNDVLQGLVIDDYFSVSIEPCGFAEGSSAAFDRFKRADRVYRQECLLGSPHKDIVEQCRAKIAGAELDASPETLALDVATAGSPAQKRLALSLVSLELSKLRWTTDSLHACLVGGWTSALMFRRQLMSVLFHSHTLVDSSLLDSSSPKVVPLPRKVAEELTLLAILAPLMCADLRAAQSKSVFCTDPSDRKGAIVESCVPAHLGRFLWRTGSKKGGYAKLMNKEEARLCKAYGYDCLGFDEPSHAAWTSPKRSPLLRYDFIEVCGGAAKVSKYLAKDGWVIGPCLDLDRSGHFDLSSFDLLRWILYLLENSLLDGFLVQPPCTTFSPAQHPALRSYHLPRGFSPLEPRTLLGTCLALRSLALIMVSSRIGALGMLEQSRRSKMAWLPEWRWLVENGWAHEEWLASCMYGSMHQKEFRFLVANLESSQLHRKCDRKHRHVKVEGKFTKASAVYTDELAEALAQCFSKGLRRKKACEAYREVDVVGLESVVFNDLLLSAHWSVKDEWHWKNPAHINIHETAAVSRLFKQVAIDSPKTRFSVGIDSHVALSALAKGRSPSYGLRPVLRRAACSCLAGALYPSFHFAPTRWNVADCPTRDVPLPPPSKGSFCQDLSFGELLSLSLRFLV